MASIIMDGKLLSNKIIENIANNIKEKNIKVGLAVIIIGDDPASKTYVATKKKQCKNVGIYFEEISLSKDISEDELLKLVNELNHREDINGILIQHPIPHHLDEKKVWETIAPEKDVDGFNPKNAGMLLSDMDGFVPCTPLGVTKILDEYNIDVAGKNCVIIGRSNIVGKPMAMLLLQRNATVTICHSKTLNLTEFTKKADILIVAVGKPNLIKKDMVKQGAIVIDVGINRVEDKLIGDVDFEEVKNIASYITPVPGGVGPMTIAMLLSNVLKSYYKKERYFGQL